MSLDRVKQLTQVDNIVIEKVYEIIQEKLLYRLQHSLDNISEIPEALEFIVDEVSIKRFNRIGSEAMTAESVGAQSMTFMQSNDFDEFDDAINGYINSQEDARHKKGVIRFL